MATIAVLQEFLAWALLALLAVVLAWALLSDNRRIPEAPERRPPAPARSHASSLSQKLPEQVGSEATPLIEACIDSSQTGLAIVDANGNVVKLNRLFAELWELPAGRIPHRWQALVDHMVRRAQDADALRAILEQAGQSEGPLTYAVELHDGAIREGAITPAIGNKQKVLGWMVSIRDTSAASAAARDLRSANERLLDLGRLKSQLLANVVTANTERLAAQEQLRAANARLEELLAFKSQLLSNVSHELGTPLTPVRLQLHLISSERLGPLTPKQRKAIGIVERNLERMTNLVRDVLEVARLDAGRLRLDRESMDVGEAILDAVESLDLQAREAGVTLQRTTTEELPVYADRNRVSQVLFNLLTNAIKYSPKGSVVEVRGARRDDHVVVEVEDHGMGMTKAQLQRLFRPFSQVQEGRRQKHGSGLGLYIARGFAEEHGGTLKGASRGPDQGSLFTLTLPLSPGNDHEDQADTAAPTPQAHDPPAHARPPRPQASLRAGESRQSDRDEQPLA